MTGNTIILIDEIETHLHTKYMNRMFQALKALVIGDVPLRISSTRS
jgi:predicted ATP-dependent endonuclease of OLD family